MVGTCHLDAGCHVLADQAGRPEHALVVAELVFALDGRGRVARAAERRGQAEGVALTCGRDADAPRARPQVRASRLGHLRHTAAASGHRSEHTRQGMVFRRRCGRLGVELGRGRGREVLVVRLLVESGLHLGLLDRGGKVEAKALFVARQALGDANASHADHATTILGVDLDGLARARCQEPPHFGLPRFPVGRQLVDVHHLDERFEELGVEVLRQMVSEDEKLVRRLCGDAGRHCVRALVLGRDSERRCRGVRVSLLLALSLGL